MHVWQCASGYRGVSNTCCSRFNTICVSCCQYNLEGLTEQSGHHINYTIPMHHV